MDTNNDRSSGAYGAMDHYVDGETRPSAGEQIRRTVLSWPGTTEAEHRFGGVAFFLGRRELGHVHGDDLADLAFPRRIRDELVRTGRAMPHHVLPDSSVVSYAIESSDDVPGAVALFRLAYDRATEARDRRTGAENRGAADAVSEETREERGPGES